MFVFSGAAAAFFGGVINMNKDDLGGPNKHSPADPDKLAAMSAEMSQKDKIQMRQAALKKKLEAEKAKKVAENLKKQT